MNGKLKKVYKLYKLKFFNLFTRVIMLSQILEKQDKYLAIILNIKMIK
jgi:hypothetical protein